MTRWWEITFFLAPLNLWLRRRKVEGKKLGPIRRLIARWDLRRGYLVFGVLFHLGLTVLWRSELCVVLMNKFPYNNGHLLIAPLAHKAELEDLSGAEQCDLQAQTTQCVRFDTGFARSGHVAENTPSWLVIIASSDAGV